MFDPHREGALVMPRPPMCHPLRQVKRKKEKISSKQGLKIAYFEIKTLKKEFFKEHLNLNADEISKQFLL